MSSNEEKQHLAVEREALRAFWEGDRSTPFVLERHEAHCVCDVLFPSRVAELKVGFWYFLGRMVRCLPGSFLKVLGYRMLGVRIGRGTYIAPDVVIDPFYPWLIEIGEDCFLGMGCRLVTHEYTARHFRIGSVRIGNGTVVGGWSTVRSGVTLGEKVTVGLQSYVNKDVLDGVTVGGVPARPLRTDAAKPEEGRQWAS